MALVTLVVAPAQAQTPGAWQTLNPSGPNRQEVSYVELDGKLYLGGGSNDALFDGVTDTHEVYDPATGAWSNIEPLDVAVDHVQSVALGGKIYYIGGLLAWPQPASNAVQIYDPATDSFTSGAPMPAGRARGAGGVAVHDGKIYYAGGMAGGDAVAWFDVYDPAANGGSGAWSTLPDMPRVRDHFHAAVVGGNFYAIGGRDSGQSIGGSMITHNDAFDFSTGVWETGKAPLPTARGGFATAVLNGEIIVIGGEGGGNSFDDVEAYHTLNDSWRTLAAMPTARHGIQAAVCNGGVYVAAGGRTQGGGNPTNVHEAFFFGDPTPCGSEPEPDPDPTPDPDPSPTPEPPETPITPPDGEEVQRGPCAGHQKGSTQPNPGDPSGVGQIIVGTDGDDTLQGTSGNDIVCGLAGNDLIRGGPGNDLIVGGPGSDDLRGGRGNDEIRGNAGADTLRGGPGRDLLLGGGGRDVLMGGRGADRLFGGPGPDRLFGGPRPGQNFLHGGNGFDRCVGRPNTIFHPSCNVQSAHTPRLAHLASRRTYASDS